MQIYTILLWYLRRTVKNWAQEYFRKERTRSHQRLHYPSSGKCSIIFAHSQRSASLFSLILEPSKLFSVNLDFPCGNFEQLGGLISTQDNWVNKKDSRIKSVFFSYDEYMHSSRLLNGSWVSQLHICSHAYIEMNVCFRIYDIDFCDDGQRILRHSL